MDGMKTPTHLGDVDGQQDVDHAAVEAAERASEDEEAQRPAAGQPPAEVSSSLRLAGRIRVLIVLRC